MELHYIPFEGQFIVYRPLLRLAFLGNAPLVEYVRARTSGDRAGERRPDVESFLDSIRFWEPDPPPPAEWRPEGEHRPTTAVLLMTSACNLRCTYCYAFGGEGELRQMTWPLAQATIDVVYENARDTGRERFGLTLHGGGEPTANWTVLTRAVGRARDKDLPCEITMATNGVLSREKRDFVIRHFSSVSLSFDGVREVQDVQRPTAGGSGSFDAVMQTIHAFDEAGFPYGVRITVRPETFSTLAESVELICRETRCRGIQIEPTYTGARGGHADPDPGQAEAFIRSFRAAFEIAARAGRSCFYSGAQTWTVSTSFCRAARDALVVTPEGDLVTCFEVHDRTHPLAKEFTVGRIVGGGESGEGRGERESPSAQRDPRPSGSGRSDAGSFIQLPVIERPSLRVEVDRAALAAYADKESARHAECETCHCYRHCAGDCATRRTLDPLVDHGRCHVNRVLTRDLLAWYIAAGGGVWDGRLAGARTDPNPWAEGWPYDTRERTESCSN